VLATPSKNKKAERINKIFGYLKWTRGVCGISDSISQLLVRKKIIRENILTLFLSKLLPVGI